MEDGRADDSRQGSAPADYSRSPVPAAQSVTGLRIATILTGVMIALPAFVMGAELSYSLGAAGAVAASVLGGALLALVAALGGVAGARSRLSTYMLVIEAFGTQGGRMVNAVLGLALLGWFGVVAAMFGRALTEAADAAGLALPPDGAVVASCLVVAITVLVGFRALDLLSALVTPLKFALLIWTFAAALSAQADSVWTFVPAQPIGLGAGVSMVTGGLLVGATLAPDICRYARSPVAAAIACAVAYGASFPVILLLSGLPSLVTGEKDLVVIMLTLGLGVPAMIVVVLTAWSTNVMNLYSASLVAATVSPRMPRGFVVAALCAIGAAVALAGVSDRLVPFLVGLSIAIPPIAGVYLAAFYASARWGRDRGPRRWRTDAFVAWAAAVAACLGLQHAGTTVTGTAALDSLIASSLLYAVLNECRVRLGRSRAGSAPGHR